MKKIKSKAKVKAKKVAQTKTTKTIRKKSSKDNKKALPKRKEIVVAVSGGFDPVHIGHVRMFNEAKKLGHRLVVILNNDNWLKAKKGYAFMSQQERKEIIEAFEAVDEVVISSHPEDPADMSVCDDLILVKPHIFCNGGDRTNKNVPEIPLCEQLGCQMIYNVGEGGKVQSSSWLVAKVNDNVKTKRGKGK